MHVEPVITSNRSRAQPMSSSEIECIESTVVYRNRWMIVREDRIRREKAGEGTYGVVEKPDFAVIAAVEAESIHLVEQYRYPVRERFWELPQGSWESGSGDPLALAASELREETGLAARTMTHVGHLFMAYGYSTQGYDVFLATNLVPSPGKKDAEEEGLIAASFPIAEFESMVASGAIKDATTVAAYGLLKLKNLL